MTWSVPSYGSCGVNTVTSLSGDTLHGEQRAMPIHRQQHCHSLMSCVA